MVIKEIDKGIKRPFKMRKGQRCKKGLKKRTMMNG